VVRVVLALLPSTAFLSALPAALFRRLFATLFAASAGGFFATFVALVDRSPRTSLGFFTADASLPVSLFDVLGLSLLLLGIFLLSILWACSLPCNKRRQPPLTERWTAVVRKSYMGYEVAMLSARGRYGRCWLARLGSRYFAAARYDIHPLLATRMFVGDFVIA
jgi:lysylphosphatidylglycerol synthetase-like protein (DUF2156 family)